MNTPEGYTIEQYSITDNGFDTVGVYEPATELDEMYLVIPKHAKLKAVPTTDQQFAPWLQQSGVAHVVIMEPPCTRVEQSPFLLSRRVQINSFPAAGCHDIYDDDRTIPQNLPQLVQERIDQGWEVDDELKKLLKLK